MITVVTGPAVSIRTVIAASSRKGLWNHNIDCRAAAKPLGKAGDLRQ
jgi:hypothetical protein